MDTFTSSLAGFVIFSVLGFMSKQLGIDIGKVVQSGTSTKTSNILMFKATVFIICHVIKMID